LQRHDFIDHLGIWANGAVDDDIVFLFDDGVLIPEVTFSEGGSFSIQVPFPFFPDRKYAYSDIRYRPQKSQGQQVTSSEVVKQDEIHG
jgi:hypothetical protein